MYGAVGLTDDGVGSGMAPFVGCHGNVAGSVSDGGFPVNFRIAAIVVLKMRFRSGMGRCSMQRMSSWATWDVCSVGVRVGS